MDGTGIGNRWTAKQEREDYERIMKNWRPRGLRTLGREFSTKDGRKEKKGDSSD